MGADAENNEETNRPDDRYFPRWQVENRVLYQLEDDPQVHEASTRDFSCAGACLSVDKDIGLNQKIKLTVYLSSQECVSLTGQTLWAKQQEDQRQIGVSFFNTSPQTQDLILQHAFEIRKDELLKHWYQGWNGRPSF